MRVFEQRREPGFRCNLADIAMLAASLGASAWLHTQELGPISWLPAYVTGTFFLFCNVFRVGPVQEVTWAVVMVATCLATMALDLPFWWTVLPVTVPATAAVVAWAYVTGRHKGILAPSVRP